ncbi:hypothetical protein [Methanobrevibacter sp.]|uniref:hypothetical protein n=1 Tax=Methanobrevibacter sp. TaxID=66852 RepID=UPI0038688381
MTEKPKQTPEEELDYPNKYMYEEGILWECNDGCRFELLGDTVARLLNEQHDTIHELKELLHTILTQIDIENINTLNEVFSARIMFTQNEFKMIKEIWNENSMGYY